VNRNEYDVDGSQIELAAQEGMRYFDLYHGVELTPGRSQGGPIVLSFLIEAQGYGALLVSPAAPSADVEKLMANMKELSAAPLATYSHEWKVLPQHLVPIVPTKAPSVQPAEMIRIPAGDFRFRVEGIEIEGFDDVGVDVQYPWENTPRRFHDHPVHVNSFWIDKYP
jgi:gamma-glutamyl hercynylcysteine S-oxide synthase